MGELTYMPYTEQQRKDAAAWLLANDRRLYTEGRPMAEAAKEFSDHIGWRASAHFLGRVAAKLRKAKQTRYAGHAPILPGLIWKGYTGAVWSEIGAACRWLLRNEGADLSNEYMARRIADGIIGFKRIPQIPVEAVRLARAMLGGKSDG